MIRQKRVFLSNHWLSKSYSLPLSGCLWLQQFSSLGRENVKNKHALKNLQTSATFTSQVLWHRIIQFLHIFSLKTLTLLQHEKTLVLPPLSIYITWSCFGQNWTRDASLFFPVIFVISHKLLSLPLLYDKTIIFKDKKLNWDVLFNQTECLDIWAHKYCRLACFILRLVIKLTPSWPVVEAQV